MNKLDLRTGSQNSFKCRGLTVIALEVNGLNFPKRQRLGYWIQKTRFICPQKTHFSYKDTQRLKLKGWKKIFHLNSTKGELGGYIIVRQKRL